MHAWKVSIYTIYKNKPVKADPSCLHTVQGLFKIQWPCCPDTTQSVWISLQPESGHIVHILYGVQKSSAIRVVSLQTLTLRTAKMNMTDVLPSAALVYRFLQALGHEASASSVAQALGIAPSQLEPMLRHWVEAGFFLSIPDKPGRYRVAPEAAGLTVGDAFRRQEYREMATILSDMENGRDLAACESILAHIDTLLERSKVGGALLCFELALGLMGRLTELFINEGVPLADAQNFHIPQKMERAYTRPLSAPSTQRGQQFLAAVLKAADISMYLTKFHNETMRLCIFARRLAYAAGNEKDAILLHLMESCLENMAAECTPSRMKELHSICEQGLIRLKELDTRSSEETDNTGIQAAAFMGMFHFWHGRFQEVLQAFEEAQKHPQIWKGRFQTEMFSLYTSSAALYLGRHHQAVGILESARRAAVLDQDRFKTMWWEAQLGVVLLYMGHLDEALELFDPVIARADQESETKILHWGMRGIAAYHYMRGNIRSSHTVMHDAMRVARRNGFKRPIFSYPWMFDMLLAYEQAGFPSIEGLSLDDELNRGINGYNQHLKAAALRTQAERLLGKGENREEAVRLLRQSLQYFNLSGNPLEQERTRERLRQVEAEDEYAQSGCLVDSPIKMPGMSGGTDYRGRCSENDDLANSGCLCSGVTRTDDQPDWLSQIENNCRLALNSIQGITDLRRNACQIAYIASCELGAERAALFRMSADGTLHAEGACNISPTEVGTGQLASFLANMKETLVVPLFLDDVDRVSLILPLRLNSEQRWLLYLESRYATKTLSVIPRATQEALMRIFAQHLLSVVQNAVKIRHSAVKSREVAEAESYDYSSEVLLYGSPITRRVLSHARQIAATDASVLILGETGVGKELLARYIHECSCVAGNFVPVHPASISEGLFESEFFGHERGSFTGAHKQKMGLVEMANNGTLFIDEVGDIPPPMQVKLLRVFQERRFLRVGGNTEIKSEFRLVGATHKDLWQEVQTGHFREDLYYRMAVVPITLPPLRERPEDILVLARRFIDHFARRYHRTVSTVTEQDLVELLAYPWPGNVRELKSVVERAVILHREGKLDFALGATPERTVHRPIGEPDLIFDPKRGQTRTARGQSVEWLAGITEDLPTVHVLLARYIQGVLNHTNGRISGPRGALNILGMKRSTLYARLKEYGLSGKYS